MAGSRWLGALALSGLMGTVAVSCGGGGEGDGDGTVGDGSGGESNFNVSGTGSTGAIGTQIPTECQPPADDTGCVGQAFEGENVPLDIYVMFDLSCSMSCPVTQESGCCVDDTPEQDWRLQPVREAMKLFIQDSASQGISVGLGFFGDHDLQDGRSNDPSVCSVEAHSDAAVEIAPLPGAADDLIAALDAGVPQGGTPTHLAVAGACEYVTGWSAANPGRKTVILLVTDGYPEASCNADLRQTLEAVQDCYDGGAGPEIYVLGIETAEQGSLENLDDLAIEGGTEQAYMTDGADVAGSMLTALNAIRADAVIPCELSIPDPPAGETLNTNLINLGVCDPAKQVVVTPNVPDAAACGDHDGWYYDNPVAPGVIHLCEVTCDTVSAPGSTLFFSIGCQTKEEIH